MFSSLPLVFFLAVGAFAADSGLMNEACPIPLDVLVLPANPNITTLKLPPLFAVDTGSSRGNITVTGASSINLQYTWDLLTSNFSYELHVGFLNVTIEDYNFTGWVDATPLRDQTIPTGNFTGSGVITITFRNVTLKNDAILALDFIADTVSIQNLTSNFYDFELISADFGEQFLNEGEPVDWDKWTEDYHLNFFEDWAESKLEILEKLRQTSNTFLSVMTPQQIIEFMNNLDGGEEGCPTLP